MVGLLGNPPAEFVKRSETIDQCFDATGNWIAQEHATVPSVSLEDVGKRLHGREQELLIAFVQSMLKWLPEERKTAKELLQDPFVKETRGHRTV